MNHNYWLDRWAANRIGFHRTGVHPMLEKFLPQLAEAPCRTLVPFCGKSEDMAWLLGRGHDVTGVDLSELAAQAFASEQKIELKSVAMPPFVVYRAARFQFFVGDFLNFRPEIGGRFGLIYDRAALIALPPEMRADYATQLKRLMEPGGRVLLIALEYDQKQMEGPPFSVPEAEVRGLFADLRVTRLAETDELENKRGLDWMKEIVYAIQPR